jgi:hypothetical protein
VISERLIHCAALGVAPAASRSPPRYDLDDYDDDAESRGFVWERDDHVLCPPPVATALSYPKRDRRSRVDGVASSTTKAGPSGDEGEAGYSSSPAVINFTGEVIITAKK